jgi:type II secretory pathway component PulK
VAALLDWQDSDDEPRPLGAERAWYQSHNRPMPSNGPLSGIGELTLVRGFEALGYSDSRLGSLEELVAFDRKRVAINSAPFPVLATLPGFTEETVTRTIERRREGAEPLSSLEQLGHELSAATRDSLHKYAGELNSRIAFVPDAWILTAHAGSDSAQGAMAGGVTIELRLVLEGSRAAIVRRQVR